MDQEALVPAQGFLSPSEAEPIDSPGFARLCARDCLSILEIVAPLLSLQFLARCCLKVTEDQNAATHLLMDFSELNHCEDCRCFLGPLSLHEQHWHHY